MIERRRSNFSTIVHQYLVTILLLTILIVGFFHYFSLNRSQNNISKDIEEFRQQYVKIQLYLVGQTDQDKRIEQLQKDIELIDKEIKKRYPKFIDKH